MGFLFDGLGEAITMIARGDPDLVHALLTTLRVSTTSTAIASLIALPGGFLVTRHEFPGKAIATGLLRTALAMPTVVVGLFVYALVARGAPLGGMKLLFTPAAIVIGQVILIVPLITALVHAALRERVKDVYEEALLLGASSLRASWKVIVESRHAVVIAIMAGFGRVVSEVGISLLLGGNIRGVTRTITTAVTLETSQGHFGLAFALGLVLLVLVLVINIVVQIAGGRRETI